jgi:hypothetical protein
MEGPMRAIIPALLVACTLVGCGSFYQTQPVERQFEKSRVYDKPYDFVWSRAVDWFATHNVIIDKIEKSSGLITAKYQVVVGNKTLDPGEIHATGLYHEPTVEYHAALNMLLRSESPERTKVTVNLFGNFHAIAFWGLLAKNGPDTLDGKCISTGNLEKTVFEFIEDKK